MTKPLHDKEMSLQPQIIFTKLLQDEAESLLHDLTEIEATLRCKVPRGEELVQLKISSRENDWNFVTSLQRESLIPADQRQEVTVSALLNAERYFMSGFLAKRKDGFYSLALAPQVFKLQRRQHFRLRIPESYKASFELSAVNQESSGLKARVEDLSEGGCRLFLPHNRPELKAGDIIHGQFHMGNRASIPIQGEVRHIKMERRKEESQLIGIQFLEMTPALENRLFSLVMELHREFFARG